MIVYVIFIFQILSTNERFDLIILFDINQVLNGSAFRCSAAFWYFKNPHPKTLSFLSKEQHVLVVCTDK